MHQCTMSFAGFEAGLFRLSCRSGFAEIGVASQPERVHRQDRGQRNRNCQCGAQYVAAAFTSYNGV